MGGRAVSTRVGVVLLAVLYALGLLASFPEWPALAGMCAAGLVMCLVTYIYGTLLGWV